MCGICGGWMPDGAPGFDEAHAIAMRDAMRHRGPDDAGHWVSEDGRAMLGSRRLAIIDTSSAGHMPMWNEDRSAAIVFNGECYNYTEIRRNLLAKGHRFHTQTDTESVLQMYSNSSPEEMLSQVRGMFTLAIWDRQRRRLLLARDRLGIKPVYYSRQNGGILFASEVRSLLASGRVSRELDPAGTQGYFAMGSAQTPETPLAEVRALPPGHYLLLEDGRETLRPYWNLHFDEEQRSEAEWREQVQEALLDSVRRHLVADRPVGIFLSGGIDSSATVALARHVEHAKLRTYSVVFGESAYNEAAYSRRIARQFETEHHEYAVSGSDVLRQIDTMVGSLDLPSIDGMNTYLVSQVTRGDGTVVALSGLGSDEIFFGYPSFDWIPRMAALARAGRFTGPLLRAGRRFSREDIPGSRAARMSDLSSSAPLASAYFAYRGLLDTQSLTSLFRPEFANGHGFHATGYFAGLGAAGSGGNGVTALELRAYMHNQLLRDSDVMSMAHSLELRVPFLDHPLVELLARIPPKYKRSSSSEPKHLLVSSLPAKLPAEIWQRPKKGFTLPYAVWLKNELRPMAEEALISESSPLRPFCRMELLQTLWNGFLDGRVHWSKIWCAVVFARWHRQLNA
jgi:asparagine synthase (glutamine-hydrolysing)